MSKVSVKGLTWGTPEFVSIAKQGEREAETNEKISEIDNLVDSLIDDPGFSNNNGQQRARLRDVYYDLEDILGLSEEYWEKKE